MSTFRFSFVCLILLLFIAGSVAGGQTGIKETKPVFGGACRICPWGAMAEVAQAAMKPYGYDVQICFNCNTVECSQQSFPWQLTGAKDPNIFPKD